MHAFGNSQRGAATLMVSMVLLVAVTLVVIVTARSSVMEQRVSANDMRAAAAFQSAQAGMDYAMAYLRSPGGMFKNSTNIGDPADVLPPDDLEDENGRVVGSYQVAFCLSDTDPDTLSCDDVTACTAPARPSRQALILSCGWSDDGIAQAGIVQRIQNTSAMANPPTNPMTARGAVKAGGSVNVSNYFNNLTIWTGDAVESGGATKNTAVRDPSIPPPAMFDSNGDPIPIPTPPQAQCNNAGNYVCTTSKDIIGPDVVHSDPSISLRTDDEFFLNFFGMTLDDYRDNMATMHLEDGDSLDGITSEIIWVDGAGGEVSYGGNFQVGSREEPVILIIDGDVRFTGGPEFYGIVYVTGDMKGAGTPTIYGSTVVQGDVDTEGTVNIVYDPVAAMGAGSELGPAGSLSGTWRDWLDPNL